MLVILHPNSVAFYCVLPMTGSLRGTSSPVDDEDDNNDDSPDDDNADSPDDKDANSNDDKVANIQVF